MLGCCRKITWNKGSSCGGVFLKRLWYLLALLLGLFLISYSLFFYVLREVTGATWREVLLQGGSVVDGTGKKSFQSDLLIRDGKIAAVGQGLKAAPGARVVDARGALLLPGFIQLVDRPLPAGKVQQELACAGITTIVCRSGSSRGPSDGQYLNYGILLGAGELRGVDAPQSLVRSCLANGLLGLTIDLESPEDAVVGLNDFVPLLEGISPRPLLVVHLPDELCLDDKRLFAALNSILPEGRELPCTLYLREFRLGKNFSGEAAVRLKGFLAKNKVRGDLNPFVLRGVAPYALTAAVGRFSADDLYFAQTPAELHYLQGKSVGEAAGAAGVQAAELAARLCSLSGGSELLVEMLETGGERNLDLPSSFCWQAPPGLFCGAEAEVPQFLDLLEGRDSPAVLEDLVYRLTSLPAELLGIRGRGKLIPGAQADLLVVRRDEQGFALESVFINGHPVLLDGRCTGYSPGMIVRN